MKIVNIVMAYKDPQQIERMINAMTHPDFYFYIHVDKKIPVQPFLYLEDLPRVRLIATRMLCNWGGYSFVKAVLNSLAQVLADSQKYDFYNLMSGQDFPIKPIAEIASFYAANVGKSFISYDEDPKKEWWSHARSRYENYHLTDLTFPGRYKLQYLINKILPKRRFPLTIKLYGSSVSSWWSLSLQSAKYLADFSAKNNKLQSFMNFTWGADEFYYATVLMNSPMRGSMVNDNLRLITWQAGSPNPRILTGMDIETMAESKKLFARKFDIKIDAEIFGQIEQKLLRRP